MIIFKKLASALYELLVFLPLVIVATLVTAISAILGCWWGNKKVWGFVPPMLWGKFTCRLAFCRISVKRESDFDASRSYVVVANHQSYFDIFLLYGYLGQKIKFVQKQSLRRIPLVGKACEVIGHVYVDNSSPQATLQTLAKAKQEIEDGSAMVIFPEGSRTLDGKIHKFKKGAFRIATEMGLPILPITINGAFDVMRRGSALVNIGKKVELLVHTPIEPDGLEIDRETDLKQTAQDTIAAGLWSRYR